MRALSTSDVPVEVLDDLRVELQPDLNLEVSGSRIVLLSADPPSWVTLLADADGWITVFKAYAAFYIAEIVKEAAKDTWKNRGKALGALISAGNRITKLAIAIAKVRQRLSPKTGFGIALPVPSDYFSARLELTGTDPDDLALQIALFVHHLPGLDALIHTEGLGDGVALGAISLEILQDASLEVSWMDKNALTVQKRVLPLEG